MKYGKEFFETYCSNDFSGKTIVDVGAQDVNGSLREFCPVGANYIGVDFMEGKGVDVILTDPYKLPFDVESVDVVVCSSVFEHSEFFWLLFLECMRIIKPDGLIYINAPSNGKVHRYPIDSWRFYPDAGRALINWARHNSYNPMLLESFIGNKVGKISGDGLWNDFVAVIVKDLNFEYLYQSRIQKFQGELFCGYSSNWENIFDGDIQNPDYRLILENQGFIERLHHSVAERESQFAGLSQLVAERESQIAGLSQLVAERESQIAGLSQLVAERESQIAGLSQSVAERDAQIQSSSESLSNILKSTSWKITAPLRRAKGFVILIHKTLTSLRETMVAHGGLVSLIQSLRKIYSSEGMVGIKRRTQSKLGLKVGQANGIELSNNIEFSVNRENIPFIDIDPGRESYIKYTRPEPIDPKVKLIAFYLPQFHPFKENDQWWGKGFTEWSNVGKALPNYRGHCQPHCPIHFGYYDLRVPSVMEEQAKLAKEFGVYGFSYYFYWFGGKVLMESPLKNMLANKNVDMPFCFTWANENWSRRWDGQENDVLIAQQHSRNDSLNFIDYLLEYFRDSRYIKINGCPVLIIYRANLIPNIFETQAMWRDRLVENGFPGLYLISAQTFGIRGPTEFGFDASVEFPPHTVNSTDISQNLEIINPDFAGQIYSYDQVVENAVVNDEPDYKLFRTAMLSWDNTARKQNNSHIFHGFSIRRYMQWLSSNVNKVYRSDKYSADEKIVFVNAWNEWAEGTHLEPDRRYGFSYLQATYDVLRNYRLDHRFEEQSPFLKSSNDVAVVVHLHYLETWPEIRAAIKNGFGDLAFDLYVTTTSIDGFEAVQTDFPSSYVELVDNRGRDILPFIALLDLVAQKDYACAVKIHSKRSVYRTDGELIRSELFESLLKNPKDTLNIVEKFREDMALGMLVPEKYLLEHNDLNMTYDEEVVASLSRILAIEYSRSRFPAGSMFWFRPRAFSQLRQLKSGTVFGVETGLADGTAAHGVERLFCIVAQNEGFSIGVC